jgi:5-methylthioadenosine/S-adenosylhomocysteine deaminase
MAGIGGARNAMSILIKNGYVVTVDPARRVLDGGYVLVGDDGKIAAVGKGDGPTGATEIVDATGMIVVPGLMNLHQHPWMNLFKGLADGMLLEPWVFNFVQPCIESLQIEDLIASSRLAALEMLRTGTTTVLTHDTGFLLPEYEAAFIEPMSEAGIRQLFARMFQCRTPKRPNHPLSAKEAAMQFNKLVERYHGANNGLTRIGMVIECNAHHTELGRSSDELVRTGYNTAVEHDLRVAVHMSGGTLSLDMGFTKYLRLTGRRDVAYLEQLGVLDHRWILKHGIQFTDTDIATIRERGCHAIYTPTSESMRGGGLGPWPNLYRAGINCALGSDGPAVDYSVDMVEQMKACIYLQNVKFLDPTVMSPERALEMATINAARAIGLESELGSLEPGKRADIAIFDLNDPQMQVVHNPLYNFICCARGADAHTVIVDGQTLLKNGKFTRTDKIDAIVAAAAASGKRIAEKTGLIRRAAPRWPVTVATAAAE